MQLIPRALFLTLSCFIILILWAAAASCFGMAAETGFGTSEIRETEGEDEVQEYDEVFLSFRHRGVRNAVIIAVYDYRTDDILLPIAELFQLLEIDHAVNPAELSVSGQFIDEDRKYEIRLGDQTARLNERSLTLEETDFLVAETDYYLHPDIYVALFDLRFQININALTLRLDARELMPIEQRLDRAQRRERIQRAQAQRETYPLLYPRQRRYLKPGFLDYNLDFIGSSQQQFFSYNFLGGAELLGGDIQSGISGTVDNETTRYRFNDTRWRYVLNENPFLTQVRVGQQNSEGLTGRRITGIVLQNDPIEPLNILGEYSIDGTATPDSEVELYINNQLVDFGQANELGIYSFSTPLTYGVSRVGITIYEPDGSIREVNRRMQVPFSFAPPGKLYYNVSAGRLRQPPRGTGEAEQLTADVRYGLANWLSLRSGGEYLSSSPEARPFAYGGLSARIQDQYLLNADAAPGYYYQFAGNVIYPNSSSINLGYTYYESDDFLYNPISANHAMNVSTFLPFQFQELPWSLRLTYDRQHLENGINERYGGNIGLRIQRLSLRAGYRDSYRLFTGSRLQTSGSLTTAATYTMNRTANVPDYLRGAFFRLQTGYNLVFDRFESLDFQLSQRVRRTGRVRLALRHNFLVKSFQAELSLTLDFSAFRSISSVQTARDRQSVRQNIRGTLGFDTSNQHTQFANRQQVGRAATAVRMYIDRSASGTFEPEEGDELIEASAIRLDRIGSTQLGRDGITRITQLQQYYRYNLEIDSRRLPNPLLVPERNEFSFIADPNHYKPIDIPFYMSGIVDGMVYRTYDNGNVSGIGGVRVILRNEDSGDKSTLRTFSSGNYYEMGVRPGTYTAWVDSTQQNFLSSISEPAFHHFEVEATAEGDFVENLDFMLVPATVRPVEDEESDEEVVPESFAEAFEGKFRKLGPYEFYIQAGSYQSWNKALEIAAGMMMQNADAFRPFIHYNQATGLYAVLAGPYRDEEEAGALLSEIDKTIETALFLRPEGDLSFNRSSLFTLLINRFDSIDAARAQQRRLAALDLPEAELIIRNAGGEYLLQLRATSRLNLLQEYKNQLQQIYDAPPALIVIADRNDARLSYAFNIIFGSTNDVQEARRLLTDCERITGISCGIQQPEARETPVYIVLRSLLESRSSATTFRGRINDSIPEQRPLYQIELRQE